MVRYQSGLRQIFALSKILRRLGYTMEIPEAGVPDPTRTLVLKSPDYEVVRWDAEEADIWARGITFTKTQVQSESWDDLVGYDYEW